MSPFVPNPPQKKKKISRTHASTPQNLQGGSELLLGPGSGTESVQVSDTSPPEGDCV